ncbi:MAG: TIGR03084 family metal-binding protein [Acidimicrobiales bacterium]
MDEICSDLADEHADLDTLVGGLDGPGWDQPTPAAGWAVRDQISHLAYFDRAAIRAIETPDAFRAEVEAVMAGVNAVQADGADGTDNPLDVHVAQGRSMTPAELLDHWRRGRVQLLGVLAPLGPRDRIAWYGPDMSARSFATARLMETWAHGQDVADALGALRAPTARLRHVAHIGVGAMAFSYLVHGLDPPGAAVRVELRPPPGVAVEGTWTWGDEGDNLVSGPAEDFCLVVTQRRHLDDVDLVIQGDEARRWMSIAQAFAGPPGPGRSPSRVHREEPH